jgi:hypothetical protein
LGTDVIIGRFPVDEISFVDAPAQSKASRLAAFDFRQTSFRTDYVLKESYGIEVN